MNRFRWKWLVPLLSILLLGLVFDVLCTSFGIGSTELTIEFVVRDSSTDNPVPYANISIEVDRFSNDPDIQNFTLKTDTDGMACKICSHIQFANKVSGLGITANSVYVQVPNWRYQVTALNYLPSEQINLDTKENRQQIRRTGPNKTKLTIIVLLKKSE